MQRYGASRGRMGSLHRHDCDAYMCVTTHICIMRLVRLSYPLFHLFPLHMNFAAISGSLRTTSYNTGLLRAAAGILDGHTVDIIDWSNVPVFNQDNEALGDPPSVADVRARIAAADALIIATPEYNYSFPGGLKNVLDWMSRSAVKPLNEKPVLVIGASGGNYGTVRAQLALRQVLTHMNAHALHRPELLVTQARTKFSDDGTLTDTATLEVFAKVLAAFVDWTTRMNAPVTTT